MEVASLPPSVHIECGGSMPDLMPMFLQINPRHMANIEDPYLQIKYIVSDKTQETSRHRRLLG